MDYTEWKLTDQEIDECERMGVDIHTVQEAKKQVYLKAGGIILNPDALSDLYEALKELSTIVLGVIEYHRGTSVILGMDSFTLQPAEKALSKAEEK